MHFIFQSSGCLFLSLFLWISDIMLSCAKMNKQKQCRHKWRWIPIEKSACRYKKKNANAKITTLRDSSKLCSYFHNRESNIMMYDNEMIRLLWDWGSYKYISRSQIVLIEILMLRVQIDKVKMRGKKGIFTMKILPRPIIVVNYKINHRIKIKYFYTYLYLYFLHQFKIINHLRCVFKKIAQNTVYQENNKSWWHQLNKTKSNLRIVYTSFFFEQCVFFCS